MLNVTILESKFGRIIPRGGDLRQVTTIGFAVTGAVENNPTYEKSTDGINWYPFNTEDVYNLDGYIYQYILPATHNYTFRIREVGHEGDVTTISHTATIDDSHGLSAIGTTPEILNSTLLAGVNKILTIKSTPNAIIRIYASVLVENVEHLENIPTYIGRANSEGIYLLVIPLVRVNQIFSVTAQSEFELESLGGNIIVGGLSTPRNAQLYVNVLIGNTTQNGRMVSVSAQGSTNYSISKDRNLPFNILPNTPFELEFGRKYVLVKDNTTGVIFSKSVHILPSGQQSVVNIGLRSQFNTVTNPNNGWEFGYINKDNNTFTLFDSYTNRQNRDAWGISGEQLPLIGYGASSLPLDSTAIAFMPHTNVDNLNNIGFGNSLAAARYTFSNAGTFNSTNIKFRKPTTSSLGSSTFHIKYIVKLNDTILKQGVLTSIEEHNLILENLTVQNGDVLYIISDCAEESDNNSPAYDELHVTFEGQFITTSYAAPSAPLAPTLANGTGNSTTELIKGTSIKIRTTPAEEWIYLNRNGFLQSMFKSTLVSTNYEYNFIGNIASNYSAKTVKNGVFSSSETSSFLVKSSVLPTLNPVSLNSTSLGLGEAVNIMTGSGTLFVYLGGQLVDSLNINTNSTITYILDTVGNYTFRLFKDGQISTVSATLVVGSTNTDCSAFVNDFILGTIGSRTLKVLLINNNKVIREIIDNNTSSLKNGNYLNNNNVVSVYKNYSTCFAFPSDNYTSSLTSANLGNIVGYTWSYLQDGSNTPIIIVTSQASNSYRIAAGTDCEGKRILFAYSQNETNANNIPDSAYVVPDGTIKLNNLGLPDSNGKEVYYKIFNLNTGSYNFFFKVENSQTPIKVVNQVLN